MTISEKPEFHVLTFKNVSQTMQAEKILKKSDIPFKLIPVPKFISTDCGICIRFEFQYMKRIKESLSGKIEYGEIKKI